MEFVIGGTAQGKSTYVRGLCDREPVITRGLAIPKKALDTDIVIWSHLEEMIREMTTAYLGEVSLKKAKDVNPDRLADYFYEKISHYIDKYHVDYVICDEVGSGIVPNEFEERLYRDVCGRICILLAKDAFHVHRVTAGIGEVIK